MNLPPEQIEMAEADGKGAELKQHKRRPRMDWDIIERERNGRSIRSLHRKNARR